MTNVTNNPKLGARLDSREMQVLYGMAQGKSNPAIGKSLHLSEDTIKTYARRVFRKLGAANRLHAVLIGVRKGLLPCPCRQALARIESEPVAS